MTNTNPHHQNPQQAPDHAKTLREAMGPGYQFAVSPEQIVRPGSEA